MVGPIRNSNVPSIVPIIGLGCSSFSAFFLSSEEQTALQAALTPEEMDPRHPRVKGWIETIHFAIMSGITLIDTAPWYGHGTSEVVVGWAVESLESSIPREKLSPSTQKWGAMRQIHKEQFDFSYDTTLSSVQRSLARMNCQYINVVQLHDPEFAPNLGDLVGRNHSCHVGVSEAGILQSVGYDGISTRSSASDSPSNNRTLRNECMGPSLGLQSLQFARHKSLLGSLHPGSQSYADYCRDNSIALMCAAPLSMGLLTDKRAS